MTTGLFRLCPMNGDDVKITQGGIPSAKSNTEISGHLNTSRKFDTSVYLSALVKPLKH